MLHGGDDRLADFFRDRGDSPTFLLCELICRKKSFGILLKPLPLIRQCVLAILKNPIEDMAQDFRVKFRKNLFPVVPVTKRIRQRLPQFRCNGTLHFGFDDLSKAGANTAIWPTQPLLDCHNYAYDRSEHDAYSDAIRRVQQAMPCTISFISYDSMSPLDMILELP